MPKKPKFTPFDPITIDFTVRQRADGRVVLGYAGDDDRTPFLGEWIINAVIASLDAE